MSDWDNQHHENHDGGHNEHHQEHQPHHEGGEHQSAPENQHHEHQDQPQGDAPVETDQVEQQDAEDRVEEADSYDEDHPNVSNPRGGEFDWSDIRKSVEFTRVLMESDKGFREHFRWILDMPLDAPVIDILSTLTPPAGRFAALAFVQDFVERNATGQLGFMDGVRIASELESSEDDYKRLIFRTLEALVAIYPASDEITDNKFRYRKNMTTEDVLGMLQRAVTSLDQHGASQFLARTQSIISVWVD